LSEIDQSEAELLIT